jgi:hypothetical protein
MGNGRRCVTELKKLLIGSLLLVLKGTLEDFEGMQTSQGKPI